MPDLMVKRSDDGIFSFQEIRTREVSAGNGMMCNKGAVAGPVLLDPFHGLKPELYIFIHSAELAAVVGTALCDLQKRPGGQ